MWTTAWALSALAWTAPSLATDSFVAASDQLSIPSLAIGSASYSNVVVRLGAVLGGPAGSAASAAGDSYDPSTAQLRVPAVMSGTSTYYNIVASVSGLVSIGSANGVDSYDGQYLTIPSVLAGTRLYGNAVITIAGIVGVRGGMPSLTQDVYDPASRQLRIPAVSYNGKVYTNVTVIVGHVISVGPSIAGVVTSGGTTGQPLSGASVYVYAAAQSQGQGPTQIAAATTDSAGRFIINGIAAGSAPGQVVYLVSVGGNAGHGANPQAALIAIAGTFGSLPHTVDLNELTTIASVWGFGANLTRMRCDAIPGNTSPDTVCTAITTLAGMPGSIANLVDVTTGAASPALTQAKPGSTQYAQLQLMDTLADILAGCVNSAGGVSGDGSACGNLLAATPNTAGLPLNGTLLSPAASDTSGSIADAAMSPDGTYLYMADSAGVVNVYLVGSNGSLTLIQQQVQSLNSPQGIAISPDGKDVFVADSAGAIVIYPVSGGMLTSSPTVISDTGNPQALALSPTGNYLYVAESTSRISVYGVSGGTATFIHSYSASGAPNGIAVSPDGRYLYVTDPSGITTWLVGVNGNIFKANAVSDTSIPTGLAVSADGSRVYVSHCYSNGGGDVTSYRSSSGNLLNPVLAVSDGNQPVDVVFAPNGTMMYVVDSATNQIVGFGISAPTDTLQAALFAASSLSPAIGSTLFQQLPPAAPGFLPLLTIAPSGWSRTSYVGGGPGGSSGGTIAAIKVVPGAADIPVGTTQAYQVLAFDGSGNFTSASGSTVIWSVSPDPGCSPSSGSVVSPANDASASYSAPATVARPSCSDIVNATVTTAGGQTFNSQGTATYFVADPATYTNLQGVIYDTGGSPSPYAELTLSGGGPGSVCQGCVLTADANGRINGWITQGREYFDSVALLGQGGGYVTYVPDVYEFFSHTSPVRLQDFHATTTTAVNNLTTYWTYFIRSSIKIYEQNGYGGANRVSLSSTNGYLPNSQEYFLLHPAPGTSGKTGLFGSGRSNYNSFAWDATGMIAVFYAPNSLGSRYFSQLNLTHTPAYGACVATDTLCYDETTYYTPTLVSSSYTWQSPLSTPLPAGSGVYSRVSVEESLTATVYSKITTTSGGSVTSKQQDLTTNVVTVTNPGFSFSTSPESGGGFSLSGSGYLYGINYSITGQFPNAQGNNTYTVADNGKNHPGQNVVWIRIGNVLNGVYTDPNDPLSNQSCTVISATQQITCTDATTGAVVSWHL